MEPKRPELALLVLTLLAFAAMGGFFLGRNTVAGPVRIVTQSAAQAVQQPEGSSVPEQPSGGTRTAPSASEPPPEEESGLSVNINTATVEELQVLPGIGETRAKAIVAYREAHGPFTYVEDLRAVSGIGEGILANIMDYITVGERDNGEDLSG